MNNQYTTDINKQHRWVIEIMNDFNKLYPVSVNKCSRCGKEIMGELQKADMQETCKGK